MAAANVLFEATSRRLDAKPVAAAERHAYVQIGWDIVSLTLLAHFAGGVENPFLLYLVFHVVLASVLMGERQTYIVAVAACAAVLGLFFLEGHGLLRHYPLLVSAAHAGRRGLDDAASPYYAAGICAALTSAFIVTAYLSNSIMRKVREAEEQLLAQNRSLREAEERIRADGEALSRATDKISELIYAAARDQSFDTRYSNPNLAACWKVRACANTQCPCHGQPPMRCWQMAGTLCDKAGPASFSEKVIRCRSCEVFRRGLSGPPDGIGRGIQQHDVHPGAQSRGAQTGPLSRGPAGAHGGDRPDGRRHRARDRQPARLSFLPPAGAFGLFDQGQGDDGAARADAAEHRADLEDRPADRGLRAAHLERRLGLRGRRQGHPRHASSAQLRPARAERGDDGRLRERAAQDDDHRAPASAGLHEHRAQRPGRDGRTGQALRARRRATTAPSRSSSPTRARA